MSAIDKIRKFIISELASGGTTDLTDSTPLIDSGVIDSFGIMALLGFIEENFSIQISGDDLMPENFSSISKIADFIFQKNGYQVEGQRGL